MDENYSISKDELIEILYGLKSSYIKLEMKNKFRSRYYKLHFKTESDLFRTVYLLNGKKYTSLFGNIGEPRINEAKLIIYIVPFKKK
jgi:hypothetical protein